MSEYKPTNQLRFVRRVVNDVITMNTITTREVKVLQQLWIEEDTDENGNGDWVRFVTASEWRDVELVDEGLKAQPIEPGTFYESCQYFNTCHKGSDGTCGGCNGPEERLKGKNNL